MNICPRGGRIAGIYEVASRPLIGGMGIVYICFDHEEQRPVALKTFKPEFLPDRAARDRFLREGATWVNLGRHPHIVRCYQVIHVDPEVYLVLELVAKEEDRADASLRSWLVPGRPLPVEQALLFGLQIARGMAHATVTIPGFVHRDLKPENVLVGRDRFTGTEVNRLRVTDFGLTRASAEGEIVSSVGEGEPLPERLGLTRVGAVLGTPGYMAPEQWERTDVNLQADIYALGCILGEMLVGRVLVRERTLRGLRQAHQEGRAGEAVVNLPETFIKPLMRCLTVDPEERYAGWEEVETALATTYEQVSGQAVPFESARDEEGDRMERVATGWSYSAIGESYMDIGKTDTALGYFERVREVGQTEGERQLQVVALTSLSSAYVNLGKAQQAIRYLEQALTISREIDDRPGKAVAHINLGKAYTALGDAHQAIVCYEQAMAINRKLGDRRVEGTILGNLGSVYVTLGDVRRAIAFYRQALVINRELGHRRHEGAILGNLGNVYTILGDVRQAIMCHDGALAIAREIGDRDGEGKALGSLGWTYAAVGDERRAITLLEQALAIAREIGDQLGEGGTLGNLGLIHARCGDMRRAIGCYEQALAIARDIGDLRGEVKALGNLGNAYKDLGDARRAIEYHQQALTISREIGDRHSEGLVIGNLGNAYAKLGDVQQAIVCYKQALALSREIGDLLSSAMTSANLAMSLAQTDQLSEALLLAEQAVRDFQQGGYLQHVQRARQLLAQIRADLRQL